MLNKFLTNSEYQEAQQVAHLEVTLSDNLFDRLFEYYFEKMPYGTQKARTGDPYQWITNQLTIDLR